MVYKISSILLISLLLFYFSGCTSSRKAESNLPLIDMKWVEHDGRMNPQSIIITLVSADTVRAAIKNSSGDDVAQEYVTVLNVGTYRLESTFTPLIPGAYFVEVQTSSDRVVRYISVTE